MPSIERKSIDRIRNEDRLLVDISSFSKAGRVLDNKTVKLLVNHKVQNVFTIGLSYEEIERLNKSKKKLDPDKIISDGIAKITDQLMNFRYRLLEKVKLFYLPFKEIDGSFSMRMKKKHLTLGKLFEQEPGLLYDREIKSGSEALMAPNDIKYIGEIVKAIYREMERLIRPYSDSKTGKKKTKRLCLNSIRLQSIYNNDRLQSAGDALPWHAVDTAFYFLYTMISINKKRIIQGCPVSLARFDPDKKVDIDEEFQYPHDFLIEAAMGILLHKIGYYHNNIHKIVSSKLVLTLEDEKSQERIKILQKNYFVIRNLLKNRNDISSITKMMCSLQYEYSDGTGFPPVNDNKFLHEFVRLFQLVDFYDEMTNPVIGKTAYSRMDVIDYIREHSEYYTYNREKVVKQKRFDEKLFNEFLEILAPYEIEEKIYIYPDNNTNEHIFTGRVYSYLNSYIPLISILKDERKGKCYKFGQLLMYIPKSVMMQARGGKILKKIPLKWLKKLRIFDMPLNPGNISLYNDIIYGKERVLSKRWRNLR